ncbi:hypothetical protein [Labrys sp. LIt4]|uniref:hypothetical protein n=1 Tax=Labrys sp. LIt4 TaxID=2821355 RepID=UPI001FD82744|nr:hypothetical protein [Labrys sp. LIt4]
MLGAMMGDGAVLAAVAKMNRDRRDAEQEQPQAQPNVRTSQDPKRRLQYPCIVGTYSQIKSICSAAQCEGQAHHIIPDFTKRYGNREDGVAGRKRIPGMPTFNDGASICLNGMAAEEQSEHAEAHGADALIEGLGSGKSYYPAGTAPILLIAAEATNQLLMMKAGDIECIAKIRAAVAAELLPVNSNLLGRTTPDALPPIGSPQYDALSRGMTATRH